jgi:hypothetical protein
MSIVTALLAFFGTALGKWIAGVVGVLIAGAGIYIKGRLKGRNIERAKQANQEAAARDIRDQVQSDVGAMSAEQIRSELAKRTRG